MAAATYNITTARVDLVKLWRKIATKLYQGFHFKNAEYDAMPGLTGFEVDWSAREILIPIDLNEGAGVASIPEGGYEAVPSSTTIDEATTTWIHLNKRFTISNIAKWIDQAQGLKPQVKSQFKHQGAKGLQAISRVFSTYYYGFGTGVLAKVNSAAGAPSYTLKDAYGLSGVGNGAYFGELFKVGDRVAILNPAGPALRGIAKITAYVAATSTMTLDGSPAGAAANDLIVLANSQENTTLADGTDYNKAANGMLDVCTSTSNMGLTHDNWTASHADATGGRLSGIRLKKAKDAIRNRGVNTPDTLTCSQGVYRDFAAQYQAAVRFADPIAIETDVEVKNGSLKIQKTRLVPPGYAFVHASKSYGKMTLFDKPGAPAFADGDKIPDKSGMVFSEDFPYQQVPTCRADFGYFSGLTEQ